MGFSVAVEDKTRNNGVNLQQRKWEEVTENFLMIRTGCLESFLEFLALETF